MESSGNGCPINILYNLKSKKREAIRLSLVT